MAIQQNFEISIFIQLNNVLQKLNNLNKKMSEEQKLNQELQLFQKTILDKIDIIRQLLQEDDKAVVDQIIMKKNNQQQPSYPKYDKKTCYYQEFWKVYLLNEIMISKIKDYSVTNKKVAAQLQILQDAEKQWSQLWIQKSRKKIRRTSDMIDKSYKCPFSQCAKPYGSDVSLNLHLKIKHNCGTKTERQALAKEICLGQQKGYKVQVTLNFPPGYMQEFRKKFRVDGTVDEQYEQEFQQ